MFARAGLVSSKMCSSTRLYVEDQLCRVEHERRAVLQQVRLALAALAHVGETLLGAIAH